jgi:hypothetical protein
MSQNANILSIIQESNLASHQQAQSEEMMMTATLGG